MPSPRVWIGLVVLAVVSFVGDRLCRSMASGASQEEQLRVVSAAVAQLPESFGKWRTVESEPLSERTLEMLQCRAHQSRVYVDDETGERVSLILLAGVTGPLVAHTPEICYSSSTFEIVERSRPEEIRGTGDRADTFDRVLFQSKGLAGQNQEVYYAWLPPGGHWQAPKNPRWALVGTPVLYKIQLATTVSSERAEPDNSAEDAGPAASAGRRFLDDLLPVLDSVLQNR